MKNQGSGSIVMIATMAEHKPMLMNGGYTASKSALRAATKQLAMELGNSNIRLNSAHIGWMWGPAVKGYFENQSEYTGIPIETLKKVITDDIPLGRIPEDEECAKAAMILASDYASAVTGASLDVNGGMFMPT
jgi:NAD(P)-dependent dehydrogenase (short-subunit alcohol dehydrogenase family)